MSRQTSRRVAMVLFAVVAMTACSQDTASPGSTQDDAAVQFPFGSPASAADADRVVEIQVTDGLAFEPSEITFALGETVTFRLINQGSLVHDFTLGDEATQAEHEADMAESGGMAHEEPNVVVIPAGETAELTWTFSEPGTVLIGCHQLGHYSAGMTGRITVES